MKIEKNLKNIFEKKLLCGILIFYFEEMLIKFNILSSIFSIFKDIMRKIKYGLIFLGKEIKYDILNQKVNKILFPAHIFSLYV